MIADNVPHVPFLAEILAYEEDSMLSCNAFPVTITLPFAIHHGKCNPKPLHMMNIIMWLGLSIQLVCHISKVSLLFFILHCIGRKDVTGRALQLQHNYFDRLMQSTEEHDISELSYLGEFVHV